MLADPMPQVLSPDLLAIVIEGDQRRFIRSRPAEVNSLVVDGRGTGRVAAKVMQFMRRGFERFLPQLLAAIRVVTECVPGGRLGFCAE